LDATTAKDDDRRPGVLLAVYTWDLLQLVTAVLIAFSAFAGHESTQGVVRSVPLIEQLVAAISAAAWAATFFIVGTLLMRRQAWVRRAQVVILAASIALAPIGLGVLALRADTRPTVGQLIGQSVIALISSVAIAAMFGERVRRWFNRPGPPPRYLFGAVALWIGGQAVVTAISAF